MDDCLFYRNAQFAYPFAGLFNPLRAFEPASYAITGPDSETGKSKQEESKKRREKKRMSQIMYSDNRRQRLNERLRLKLENRKTSETDEKGEVSGGGKASLSEVDLLSLFKNDEVKPKKRKKKKRKNRKKKKKDAAEKQRQARLAKEEAVKLADVAEPCENAKEHGETSDEGGMSEPFSPSVDRVESAEGETQSVEGETQSVEGETQSLESLQSCIEREKAVEPLTIEQEQSSRPCSEQGSDEEIKESGLEEMTLGDSDWTTYMDNREETLQKTLEDTIEQSYHNDGFTVVKKKEKKAKAKKIKRSPAMTRRPPYRQPYSRPKPKKVKQSPRKAFSSRKSVPIRQIHSKPSPPPAVEPPPQQPCQSKPVQKDESATTQYFTMPNLPQCAQGMNEPVEPLVNRPPPPGFIEQQPIPAQYATHLPIIFPAPIPQIPFTADQLPSKEEIRQQVIQLGKPFEQKTTPCCMHLQLPHGTVVNIPLCPGESAENDLIALDLSFPQPASVPPPPMFYHPPTYVPQIAPLHFAAPVNYFPHMQVQFNV